MFSIHELFRIGLGPSSSHTIGPMIAAAEFSAKISGAVDRFEAVLFGSLALTGIGHATDKAVLLGLAGYLPDKIESDMAETLYLDFSKNKHVVTNVGQVIPVDVVFEPETFLLEHPNGMTFTAYYEGEIVARSTSFSVGGGALKFQDSFNTDPGETPVSLFRYPFDSAESLIKQCRLHDMTISQLIMANEMHFQGKPEDEIGMQLDHIWKTMSDCVERGCEQQGVLPGGLGIKRRAKPLYEDLQQQALSMDPLAALDWISLFALAVNEENAAGGRVVTAPTNGAAGVIPAVLAFLVRFEGLGKTRVREFLLTSAAIGMLYKENASISAAEVGCQGEIGVASSMAAAGFAAVMNGSIAQIENAAEIAMEHHLGMTCDPIGGLVQVPCIERNTMGAIKAINAARLALRGDGVHRVSLDSVISTMLETGRDMERKYKETALGGLAVNVALC